MATKEDDFVIHYCKLQIEAGEPNIKTFAK